MTRLLPAVLLAAVAVFGPWMAPHPARQLYAGHVLEPPLRLFPLGTDSLGRCLASRLLEGARLSFAIALTVTAASALFGGTLGALAGWEGGWFSAAIRSVTNLALAFPGIIPGLPKGRQLREHLIPQTPILKRNR
jgi:peptide/nickel transport system permease protein